MVSVNFRQNDDITNQRVIEFFKKIGYEHIGKSNNSIKVEDDYLTTDIFIRKTQSGRFHLHVAFGKKYSGTENYPQVKIFAHFDFIKFKNGKERHYPDRNEKRSMREMYRINDKMISENIGFLEIKDRKCAHTTLELKFKAKFLDRIQKEYERYEKGKYRKRFNSSQCTLAIFEQEKYMHVVFVYVNIVGKDHHLIKNKAISELNKIINSLE